MSGKPLPRQRKAARPGILLRYRDRDSALGVSRETTLRLARELGVNETQVIHYALALLARQALPAYAPDDGPLSDRKLEAIRKLEAQGRMTGVTRLF